MSSINEWKVVYSVGGVGYYEANDVLTMSILTTCHIAPEKPQLEAGIESYETNNKTIDEKMAIKPHSKLVPAARFNT